MARLCFGPWLWSARLDLAAFAGSAALGLGLVAVGHVAGFGGGALPEWGFVAFVIAIDVAHVYSTLFRTYLDSEELRRHPLRYSGMPLACWAAGVALYSRDALLFWRVLAYVAVFHFVRQQVGWVALYRARAEQRGRLDRALDEAATYLATLYPLLVWHARLGETHFAWFVAGDFLDVGALVARLVPFARVAWVAALVAFAARQVALAVATRTLHLGKLVVVAATAATWWVGIVGTNSDFDFTVTNVVAHGVPYCVLLWVYARARRARAPSLLGSQIAAGGVAAFVGVLFLLAFLEELSWDRLVWHDHDWLFGSFHDVPFGGTALAFLVPLLAVPQATHYVLDGLLWRRSDAATRPAQRAAVGGTLLAPHG